MIVKAEVEQSGLIKATHQDGSIFWFYVDDQGKAHRARPYRYLADGHVVDVAYPYHDEYLPALTVQVYCP